VSGAGIEIERDYECDGGEIGGPMNTFWSRGHNLDPDQFMRAVISLALEWGSVPRIDADDAPVEMWQQNVRVGDGVEFRRTKTKPEGRHNPAFPVTVLDLDRRRPGQHHCAFTDCKNGWFMGSPLRVVMEPDGADPAAYQSVTIYTCREHRKLIPDPYYRAVVVPIGATVVLPSPAPVPGDGEGTEPRT